MSYEEYIDIRKQHIQGYDVRKGYSKKICLVGSV